MKLYKKSLKQIETLERENRRLLQEISRRQKEPEEAHLTFREKIVLHALIEHPELNDRELAEKIHLKRSTITAIKNRLLERKLYRVLNIPNFLALGYKALTFVYGSISNYTTETEKQLLKLKEIPGLYAIRVTDINFYALYVTDDLIAFQKQITPLMNTWTKTKMFKEQPTVVHSPLELNKISRFLNYAPLCNHILKLGHDIETKHWQMKDSQKKLTKNKKEVLYAIVKYPHENIMQIARRLRLSRVTVAKIIKELKREKLYKTVVMPEIKRLHCNLITLTHFRFAPGATREARTSAAKYTRKEPHAVLKVSGDRETVSIRIFHDYTEQSDMLDRAVLFYKKNGYLLDEPTVIRLIPQKTKIYHVDFSDLTKEKLQVEI